MDHFQHQLQHGLRPLQSQNLVSIPQTAGAPVPNQNFAAPASAIHSLHGPDQGIVYPQAYLAHGHLHAQHHIPSSMISAHNEHLSAPSAPYSNPQPEAPPQMRNHDHFQFPAQEAGFHEHQIPQSVQNRRRVETQEPVQDISRNPPANNTDHVVKTDAQFEGLKLIENPPKLQLWREKLFHLDHVVAMTEEEFRTYWPHVDNIYSHRSTQRYKRKPFVSHYWDCRLKGRAPGTPKSDDPAKKKRKRVARERDLCDVKIRITEYQPGPAAEEVLAGLRGQNQLSDFGNSAYLSSNAALATDQSSQQWQLSTLASQMSLAQPSAYEGKLYTIQRVNGTGGNGKVDDIAGPHRHTLEESDRIKKNSVIRWMLKDQKEKKKSINSDGKKSYHTKATGHALNTVKKHSKEHELKLFGSCFCPFVQRVWISLECKQIPYQYIEVDPYKKPQSLLDVNPRGLVPALRHGDWGCYESTVLMEYLEDIGEGRSLLPPDAKTRAISRLWSDHINRHIIPGFYHFLQEQDNSKQVEYAGELKNQISKLVDAADKEGPFFLGKDISFVDIQMAPWVIRLNRVLKPYRGWPEPEPGSRWGKWVEAIEKNEHVQATTSTDDLYLDSYERYAENRPNTSQLANAVNSGRGLP